MSDHPRESSPQERPEPATSVRPADASDSTGPDVTAPLPASGGSGDSPGAASERHSGSRPGRDDVDGGRLDADTMELPSAGARSAPDSGSGPAPAGYFSPGQSGPAAPPRRGQQIDSDPGRRDGVGEHPTSDLGTRGLGPDAGESGSRTTAFDPVSPSYGSSSSGSPSYGSSSPGAADPVAYRGSAGVPVTEAGATAAGGAAGAGFGTTRRNPTDESPMADYRGYGGRRRDEDDAGLDIADDDEPDGARTRRRGQGAAGLLGVVGLAGAAFGAFALPLQQRGSTEVFYGNLRELASHSGGLLLRVNTSRSGDVGNEMARFVWRVGMPFALGVCGLLLLGVLCWPFMRKAAGVLLGIVALATGVGLVLGARGTRDFRGGLSRSGGRALGLFDWSLGLYVAVGGLFVLLIAGAVAGVQSRE